MGSVLIIGAGPAGLTAAFELSENGENPTLLEADAHKVGGISQTVEHKGFRFDIGGHRFFSKNSEVEQLWSHWLEEDMLRVGRLSRILYRGRFFDYPLKAKNAFCNLGLFETIHCILSCLKAQMYPRRPERSFEDWVVNRFGYRLFSIFFKTYTEKVWGMRCDEISSDWAAQRIRDLNLWQTVKRALGLGGRDRTIKTLIDEFRYPRLGPGMMWEKVADSLVACGCHLHMSHRVERVVRNELGATAVEASGKLLYAEHFISTMPLRQLIEALDPPAPIDVIEAARGLRYRDFLTVAIVLDVENLFPDNWIYIHDPAVKVGRIQNYKNWSREMVPEDGCTCLGLEYFCSKDDSTWLMSDNQLIELAKNELEQLGLANEALYREGRVVRMPRAYPVYDESYHRRVERIRRFLSKEVPNVQTVGRNGMHRYNNQDHSMLTGILAARNILGQGPYDLWRVNSDAEYIEETRSSNKGRLVPRKLDCETSSCSNTRL